MMRILVIGGLWAMSAISVAHGESGDGADDLRRFLDSTTSLQADFRQSLYAPESDRPQVSEGVLMIKRPGRFRWEYTVPDGQLVVCDGDQVWMFDQDLEQVTVRPVDDTLRGTPAMLLSGQATLDQTFEIVRTYAEDGLDWVELRPLSGSPDFETVRIGLVDGVMARMELRDSLGQMTRIELTAVQVNVSLDDSLFVFVPPAGADVIGQGGDL